MKRVSVARMATANSVEGPMRGGLELFFCAAEHLLSFKKTQTPGSRLVRAGFSG